MSKTSSTDARHSARERRILTDNQLRRGLYMMSLMTLLFPPLLGGVIMVLVGIYPVSDFFQTLLSYASLYPFSVMFPLLFITGKIANKIIGIPLLEKEAANNTAHKFLKPFPWYLFLFLILYCIGGDLVTNYSLEKAGHLQFTHEDSLFALIGIIPAVLVTAFPIYFMFTNFIGLYLAPRGVHVVATPMSVKILMLGLMTPILIDSMLIVYFYRRTDYFASDTILLWGLLILLAGAGTYIALRSFRQGMQPLQDYINSDGLDVGLETGQLDSQTLDEVGVLTAHLKQKITQVLELEKQLATNAQLNESLLRMSRALEESRTYEGIAACLRDEISKVSPYKETWLLLAEEDDRYFRPVAALGENIMLSTENSQIQRLDMFGDPFLRDLYGARKTIVVEDMMSDPRTNKELVKIAGHRTTIHTPIIIAGKRVGMFGTGSFQQDGVIPPAAEVIQYMESVANHLAAAVDRVQYIEQRRQNAELLEKEKRFANTIIENVGALVVVLDAEGKVTRFNRASEILSGYSQEELIGKYVWDYLLVPEERESVRVNAFNALTHDPEKIASKYTNYWLSRDGSKHLIDWSNTVIKNSQGQVEYIISLGIDVTDQRAAEEELQRSRETYSRAEAIAHIGSWDWNIITNELHWTDEIFRIFGLTPQSFPATYPAFLEAIYPEDQDMVVDAVNQCVADPNHPYAIEHRVLRPDGEIRQVFERGKVYCDENGTPVRMIGTVYDVTDQKTAERELQLYRDHLEELVKERTAELEQAKEAAESANRAKSDFLSRMSHELRTPMNAILGFSQVMELEDLNEAQMDFIHEIHRAGNHLFELISELLDLSRIESGRISTVMSSHKIDEVVEHAITMVSSTLDDKKITLENLCKQDSFVFTDETRLMQILVNFLSNAIKYNRENGSVTINCITIPSGILRVSVTDTGIGIMPEKLPDLFTPFERLGAEYSGIDGTGIGLAFSKKLAELMGAELGVDSRPGEGSTFWIDLRLSETSEKKLEENTISQQTLPGMNTVLYIEDNPANLKVVESMLKHYPRLKLISAMSGEMGLDLAKRYVPDVILLDIHLPGMDGYQVLRILQQTDTTSHIPVIALTADAMPLDIEQGLQAGFRSYVSKPIKIDELISAIESALSSRPSLT